MGLKHHGGGEIQAVNTQWCWKMCGEVVGVKIHGDDEKMCGGGWQVAVEMWKIHASGGVVAI